MYNKTCKNIIGLKVLRAWSYLRNIGDEWLPSASLGWGLAADQGGEGRQDQEPRHRHRGGRPHVIILSSAIVWCWSLLRLSRGQFVTIPQLNPTNDIDFALWWRLPSAGPSFKSWECSRHSSFYTFHTVDCSPVSNFTDDPAGSMKNSLNGSLSRKVYIHSSFFVFRQ